MSNETNSKTTDDGIIPEAGFHEISDRNRRSSNAESLPPGVAVVTGAARGIGRAIATELLEAGYSVLLSDVDRDRLVSTETNLASRWPGKVRSRLADVRRLQDVKDLADAAYDLGAALDVWVNNAGILRDGLLLRMSESDWDEVMDVNLKGSFYGTQVAARKMIRARRGSIINIGSVSGYYGNAGQSNYSAAKAGLLALTRSSARELAGRGVRVNAVAAGFVDNEFVSQVPRGVVEDLLSRIPLRHGGDPEQYIARAVRFLGSADAGFITGAVLRVDGGMAIGF
ncbi:MAG: SDR family oxidoreductase [Leptospiraceae bacterium]|nr:SDR family oxidoreductase [Leptospiraceae bacterium]MCB1305648.1 SDR family oxidoreductase [Leptospiraceae bacterium]